VDRFHWTLDEIYPMDIERLLPFIGYYPYWRRRAEKPGRQAVPIERQAYCDEVNWL